MCIYSIPSIAEVVVKTIGREPDVTPVCDSATLHIITLIVCKIRREISGGEECRLLYQHGQDFVHECDSRFTLKTENETVFLHLTGLTPEDSGNYSCECSHVRGTDILHVIITVKGKCCMLLHGYSSCTVSIVLTCCCICFSDTDVFYFGLLHFRGRRGQHFSYYNAHLCHCDQLRHCFYLCNVFSSWARRDENTSQVKMFYVTLRI